ncbi:hypothetical protein GPECTOR_26g474 [Gonium pectorale]|uniref:FAS1 domain-containing protein n=1 Tax=Gonium pectorale TaxID=33097 RepID=A0A150GFD8_GONPE|nr:hypothetical protein GPECTOR_26g474 [Gonium pectorale]|eukprot:KXZ48571.1 hypothetical protein GPECTOR_26g474 [Gonium pectorale]
MTGRLAALTVLVVVAWPGAAVSGQPANGGSGSGSNIAAEQQAAVTGGPSAAAAASPKAYICADPDLSTLCRILEAAGGGSVIRRGATQLSSPSSTDTIFAPTNQAFAQDAQKLADFFGVSSLGALDTSPQSADRLLQHLVISGQAITSRAFNDGAKYTSLLGDELELKVLKGTDGFYVESDETRAAILQADILAGRAVVHKVDQVPLPDNFL